MFSQTELAGRLVDALLGLFFEPSAVSGGWLRFAAQKVYHVLLFGGMGALLALRTKPASTLEVIAWCVGFSALAETMQTLAPNRHASIWDALLNMTSALGAYALTGRASAPDSRRGFFAPRPR